jgi:8-oxo-dGTP pyrophosphatase MutT (NUDIX family)
MHLHYSIYYFVTYCIINIKLDNIFIIFIITNILAYNKSIIKMYDNISKSAFNSLVSRYNRASNKGSYLVKAIDNKKSYEGEENYKNKYKNKEKEKGRGKENKIFPYNFSEINAQKKFTKVYGAILRVLNEDKTLIKYAMVKGRYTGKWSFPKGHAHVNEPVSECIMRELKEETGIEVLPQESSIVDLSFGKYYIYDVKNECELRPSDTHEILYAKWVTLSDMASMNLNADANEYRRLILSP